MSNALTTSAFPGRFAAQSLRQIARIIVIVAILGLFFEGVGNIFARSASAATISLPGAKVSRAESATSWPMFGNNVYSDCAVASAGDLIEAQNMELNGSPSTLTDNQAESLFLSMGGSVNQGIVISTVLNKWQTTGLDGNVIASSAQLGNSNQAATEQAIYLLGGIIGEALLTPQTQLELTNGQTVTDTTPGSPALAHALTFIGYNSQYLTAVTFGHVVQVSWAWWLKNGVAEYGVIPSSFVAAGHGPVANVSASYLTTWLSGQNVA